MANELAFPTRFAHLARESFGEGFRPQNLSVEAITTVSVISVGRLSAGLIVRASSCNSIPEHIRPNSEALRHRGSVSLNTMSELKA